MGGLAGGSRAYCMIGICRLPFSDPDQLNPNPIPIPTRNSDVRALLQSSCDYTYICVSGAMETSER